MKIYFGADRLVMILFRSAALVILALSLAAAVQTRADLSVSFLYGVAGGIVGRLLWKLGKVE